MSEQMNNLSEPPQASAQTAQAVLSTAPGQAGRGGRVLSALQRPSVLIAALALLLLGWQWLETRERLGGLQQELARRLADSDALARESRALVKQNQEMLQALAAKTGGLEARLDEAQGQQAALENMYQELSHSRDERVLAEIEQSVSIAAQQLQLAGNVEAALIALQGADVRLARSTQAQWLPLRKLINRDIERLKALPLADVPGIALKLESVISAADTLPLAFEQRARVAPAVKPKVLEGQGADWEVLAHEVWLELKQLIRIERTDQPEAALLAPNQVFFLRENLKLRLINARLALLQRDGKTYREDLNQAQRWLQRYFDVREKPVEGAISTLKGLSNADLSLELPNLNETLSSLRSFKLTRDGK